MTVREEAVKKRLTARLEAVTAESLEPPAVDPRTAAVAAMMVANFIGAEAVRKRFTPLATARLFDGDALDDLPVAARFVLRIVPKLGAELCQRDTSPDDSLLARVKATKGQLLEIAERHLTHTDEAHGRIVTIRMGDGPADEVYDLRMLADLWRDYGDALASEAPAAYRRGAEREARDLATNLELALLGPLSRHDRQWRSYLHRALAMLVPLYDEVCRAGRFLFHDEKPEARFPTLASVARVRRRLKKETSRRAGESERPVPAPPSNRASISPEVSLVEVSDEDEAAFAEAMVSIPPPPPATTEIASTASIAGIDPVEVVRLDFSTTTAPGEDADTNLDTPELDLELTHVSESNFYSDVAGQRVGLFVATFVVKALGTPIAMRLSLPQRGEPFLVRGVVDWVREFSPSIDAPPGMGVALDPLGSADQQAVAEFMKLRAPILHDD
jgi:Tfp pilus assembly protein PilZ